MAGRYFVYDIFSDWVAMFALAICNAVHIIHNDVWMEREKLFKNLSEKYTEKEMEVFAQMFAWLCDALEEEMTDLLGEIYMELEIGNKYLGQFFTPFAVSEMCARTIIHPDDIPREGPIRIMEPSCGAGGMCVAAIKVLRESVPDWQRRVEFLCQDLDWKGVYMTYVTLSLLGVKGIVAQGDTLTDPYKPGYPEHRVFRTPASMGLLMF